MIGGNYSLRKSIDSADKGYEDAAVRLISARKYERLLFLIFGFPHSARRSLILVIALPYHCT